MTDSIITANTRQDCGHIYLTGYRGSGKTAVAHALAAIIDFPVLDLDAEIILATGKTIAEIFRDSDEETFRNLETDCLTAVSKRTPPGDSPRLPCPQIVSLGGGAVLREQNRALIKQSGRCIWLDAAPHDIVDRLKGDDATASQRPGLTELPMADEVKTLMEARRPIYQAVSDLRVDTSGLSIEDVAGQIAKWLTLPNKG